MADNAAEALAQALVKEAEPLGLKSIIDFVFYMLLRPGVNGNEPTKIMDRFVELLGPWLLTEGETFATVDALPDPGNVALQAPAGLDGKFETRIQELERTVHAIITDKRRTEPNEENNAERIKVVMDIYCQLFCSLVDLRFEKGSPEVEALLPKITDVKSLGCEFFCSLFGLTESKQLKRHKERAMYYGSEFLCAIIDIRFKESRSDVGDWWWNANQVEVHGCGLLWVLINLRFGERDSTAPRRNGQGKSYVWNWGEPAFGELMLFVKHRDEDTKVNVYIDTGIQHQEVLEDVRP
ncbi:hypothetical protein C8A03DRAFT_34930 [Achaetomium macrosporum]|uniref:Uncharacterized protein n=1 Tax=Achaetomium macrosporum TaxID=79813 RepID=A0AAN7C8U8_9PEZI|nr:hypothetical protein C8A03DRAFT_34930 [Achaetomium macrosporum]